MSSWENAGARAALRGAFPIGLLGSVGKVTVVVLRYPVKLVGFFTHCDLGATGLPLKLGRCENSVPDEAAPAVKAKAYEG